MSSTRLKLSVHRYHLERPLPGVEVATASGVDGASLEQYVGSSSRAAP